MHPKEEHKEEHMEHAAPKHKMSMDPDKNYRNLLIMAILSFISMYILMYAMVNALPNVFNNVNQVYMAGLMTAPMIVFELFLMSMMYPDKRRNLLILIVSVLAGLVFFVAIRQQAAVGDKQFLRSMIPHHAGAILMCEQAAITDPEIQQLCQEIIQTQVEEINQMKSILERME